MADNLFLKPSEFYQRELNPLAQYVDQNSFYLSKMTGKPKEETRAFIVNGIKGKQFEGQIDPVVHFFERDENLDRHKTSIRLSQYFNEVVRNGEILTPTFTSYVPTSVRKSLLVGFIDTNVKIRSKAKKEAFKAQAEGNEDLYQMKNNEQDNRKRYNNSMSGAFAAGGSILNNPTGHSTLTSITRTVSSMGNSSNEKIIAGNRHYRNPDVTLANVITITSSMDRLEFQAVMEKYQLTYPTVEETLNCIRYSSDFYWKDPRAFKKIADFVEKLDPLERAAFVYTGDFYHVRKHNEKFVRDFLNSLSRKVKGLSFENGTKLIHKFDEQIVNYAHQICMDEVRGIGKDYDKLNETDLNTLLGTCKNIEDVILAHKDFITAIFLTKNVPASTAYIPNMIRRTVVLSDTDSTMFSLDEWVIWHRGRLVFDQEGFALAGAVMFIATNCIAHCLAIFSANMNVEREKLHLLAMKPEFVFPLHCQTSVAKHYFASILVKEGNVYKEQKWEIKGVYLKNSAAPRDLIEDSQSKMKEIMKKVYAGEKISLVKELERISGIERKIKASLLNGDVAYYKQSKIKSPEAYARSAEESPYLHHMLWTSVFEPKYGAIGDPPYNVIKIPTQADNPTRLKQWIDGIADRELAERFAKWLAARNKRVLPTVYLSSQYVAAFGIPAEIKSVIDVKKVTLELTMTDRMILETLGYFIKPGWLVSETGY